MKCCRTKMFALRTQIPEHQFPPKMVTQFFIVFFFFFIVLFELTYTFITVPCLLSFINYTQQDFMPGKTMSTDCEII